ncbi:MAG: hypothetical protein ACLFTS_02815 [Candidatus Paceibacterota bacterium]
MRRQEHPQETICLGDQSPWAGGLLRLAAMREYTSDLKYFIHDGDAPWVAGNYDTPRVVKGWPKPSYFSLATRHPWSLATPDVSLEAPQASLKTPKGLSRLVGKTTKRTIFGMVNDPQLLELVKEILCEELAWSERLGDWLGVGGRYEIPKNGNLLELAEDLNPTDIPVKSFVELFRESLPLVYKELPKSYFWEIKPDDGTRMPCAGLNGNIVIPKGKALPLELAARGWALACTCLGYLDDVVALRDGYFPGLPIKIYYIDFDWKIEPDPVNFLLESFKEKKKKRGQKIPDFNGAEDSLNDYWKKRPTSISSKVLGGKLRPSFVRKVL